MRVLYVYCHPLPESFHAALRKMALDGLAAAGHEIDLADLYADGFDPLMSPQMRRDYHDTARNREGIENYAARLQAAEALVLQFPVWSFGPPAMLKGWMDRLLSPGIAFDLSDPHKARPLLHNLRRIAGITSYGRPWWNALAVGDPPRRLVTRYLPRFSPHRARADYHALYHMNVATQEQRVAFMDKVQKAMARFAK
jgi:putative NADPH-quinone reductase